MLVSLVQFHTTILYVFIWFTCYTFFLIVLKTIVNNTEQCYFGLRCLNKVIIINIYKVSATKNKTESESKIETSDRRLGKYEC